MPLPREPEPGISLGAQLRKNGGLYLGGAVLLAAQQGLLAGRDLLVRTAVDALALAEQSGAARAALWLFLLSIGAAVARLGSRAALFTAGRNGEFELRAAFLRQLHRLGPSFFRRMPTGEIMSRATNDLQQVRLLLGFGVLNVASSALALSSALYVMFTISWRLTLASLCTWPFLALVTRTFSWRLFAAQRDNQQALGEMSDRVLSSLAGVRVVRSFAMERAVVEDFDGVNEDYLVRSLRLARLRGLMAPIMAAVSTLGLLVVFWYGGALLVSAEPTARISMGDFVAFWLALLRLGWPILAVGFVTAIVQRGRASYRRLREIFTVAPDVRDGTASLAEPVRGELRVTGLGWSVDGVPILRDVSFELGAGASLGIVGRTGSGKSTLAALLARLAPVPPGSVFLDGVDVCTLPVATVRAAIAYAPQEAFLFSTTVADNIAFGLPAAGAADAPPAGERDGPPSSQGGGGEGVDARVLDAAGRAHVLDDLRALPDGLHTVVGERGIQLSGGQRQRVALARALAAQAPVLLLDDPLSAVDARTEAAILRALEAELGRRTVLLITHRIAAAQRCERILVLDRGQVVEQGSHDELIARGGLYALFAAEQEMERDLDAVGDVLLASAKPATAGERASHGGDSAVDASGGAS